MVQDGNFYVSGEAGAGKSLVLASIRMIYSGGNRKEQKGRTRMPLT